MKKLTTRTTFCIFFYGATASSGQRASSLPKLLNHTQKHHTR